MRIEAVSVCIGYGDILHYSARHNSGLLDRHVIVTSENDEETREVCRKHNLEVVLTEDASIEGEGTFSKARAINHGLQVLSADSWHLHMDADIILPPIFRKLLELARLDPRNIYGFDRVMVKGWNEYQRFVQSGFLWHDYQCRLRCPPFPLGDRWVSPQDGMAIIGYAQLFHPQATEWRGSRVRRYPERHNSAARCDVQFSMLWDRNRRVYLPEIICVHLESEEAKLGANWTGRTTQRFGPPRDRAGTSTGCPPTGGSS